MNDRIKKLVAKSTIIALCASVLAGSSAFEKMETLIILR